jgi:hypothetical protein
MRYYTVVDEMGTPFTFPVPMPIGLDYGGEQENGVTKNIGITSASTVNDYANALDELAALHNTLLVNGQLIATGSSGEPQPVPVATIRKPWLDAPDNAVPFDPGGAAVLGAVGGTQTIVTHVVDPGMDGVITAYSWNFIGGGFVQGSGDLVAQVLRNGTPVKNYEAILVEKGSVAIPRPIAPLRIYSNDVMTIVVTHAANALLNGNVVASMVGYDYPSQS